MLEIVFCLSTEKIYILQEIFFVRCKILRGIFALIISVIYLMPFKYRLSYLLFGYFVL